MSNDHNDDGYSIDFVHYASKLEQHLRKNGISCHDADIIIEESSVIYFGNMCSSDSKLFKVIGKHRLAHLFAKSAVRAIEKHLPEAKNSFGSYHEIMRCIN
ncbi:MAG TPA: hypothetical protein VE199_00780 [Nitrososphaera sp.]|nr:hypothetical protein [Nitrososphaera sp.]